MADANHPRDRTPPAGSRRAPRWLPLVLMAAGAACLVYGFALHTVTVQPETEPAEGDPSDVPPEILPDEAPIFSPDVLFGEAPAEVTPLQTPEPAEADAATPSQALTLSESRVAREVTIGGLVRLPSGEIVRTYGPDEPAPSYCPT